LLHRSEKSVMCQLRTSTAMQQVSRFFDRFWAIFPDVLPHSATSPRGGRVVSAPLVTIVRSFLLAIFSANAPNVA
jgi:hypothetical protein